MKKLLSILCLPLFIVGCASTQNSAAQDQENDATVVKLTCHVSEAGQTVECQ